MQEPRSRVRGVGVGQRRRMGASGWVDLSLRIDSGAAVGAAMFRDTLRCPSPEWIPPDRPASPPRRR